MRSRAQKRAERAEKEARRAQRHKKAMESQAAAADETPPPAATCAVLALVGPTAARQEVVAPASFDVGRKTLGLDSPKVHRAHLRVAFIDGRWAAQLLGKNPGYVQPQHGHWYRVAEPPDWCDLHSGDVVFCSKRVPELGVRVEAVHAQAPDWRRALPAAGTLRLQALPIDDAAPPRAALSHDE